MPLIPEIEMAFSGVAVPLLPTFPRIENTIVASSPSQGTAPTVTTQSG